MGFPFVPKLVTLNNIERHNGHYFAFFSPNSIAVGADYVTVVEVRSILPATKSSPKNQVFISIWYVVPFSSNRQHLSYDDCLEVRGEIIRTVLCCIVYWKLCTVISTLRWAVLTVLSIGFSLAGPISLCVDSFVFMLVFVLSCHTAYVLYYCNTVAWTLKPNP